MRDQREFPSMMNRRTETRECYWCGDEFTTYADCNQQYCEVGCVERHRETLEEIEEGDADSINGGHYIEAERREIAENLVEAGEVVRMRNPAGVSPKYVPVDSDHYSDDRLARMSERQSSDE